MVRVFSLSLVAAQGVKVEFSERPNTLINPQAPGGAKGLRNMPDGKRKPRE